MVKRSVFECCKRCNTKSSKQIELFDFVKSIDADVIDNDMSTIGRGRPRPPPSAAAVEVMEAAEARAEQAFEATVAEEMDAWEYALED